MNAQELKDHIDCIEALSKVCIKCERLFDNDNVSEVRLVMDRILLPASVVELYQSKSYEKPKGALADAISDINEFITKRFAEMIARHKDKVKTNIVVL